MVSGLVLVERHVAQQCLLSSSWGTMSEGRRSNNHYDVPRRFDVVVHVVCGACFYSFWVSSRVRWLTKSQRRYH